jgi:oligopeptide/dipeptide ABC transporter ATP-binding protein
MSPAAVGRPREPRPTAPLLVVSDLVTSFPDGAGGRSRVIDGVDLVVARGEVVALVGESGCGKSMTALSLVSLVPKPGRVDAGSVRLRDRELRGLPVTELRRVRGAEIGMIFQEPSTSLNPVQTAGAQVVEALRLHVRMDRAAARRAALALFEQVGIPDPPARFDAFPHQLSGGLKQRVMIAIALATRPQLLIADEPTTALDVTIQAQVIELLRALASDSGTAIVLITHDLGVVNELADRVAVMYAGRIVEEGTRTAVLGTPCHPYTRGLLRAMPARARPGERLAEIPGSVPAVDAWPAGCRFAPRCPLVSDRCRTQEPARVPLGAPDAVDPLERTGAVRCHAVSEGRT